MQIEIPFISDLVGSIGGEYQHVYARSTTLVDVPEINGKDAPEAVIWRADGRLCSHQNGDRSTLWHDGSHWATMSHLGKIGERPKALIRLPQLPGVSVLQDKGFLKLLHAKEPQKLAQFRNIPELNIVRKRLSNIQFDNVNEIAADARRLAEKCIAIVDDNMMIRCPEPHIAIIHDLRGGAPTRPIMSLGKPHGFNHTQISNIEHLVSLNEADVARAITERILDGGLHDAGEDMTSLPEVLVEISESIQHPWHLESAKLAINTMLESGRTRLDQMTTDDVRRWISLARMRNRGIDNDDEALSAMKIADELQFQFQIPPFVVREFRDRLHMSIYGTMPNLQSATGALKP